MGRLNYNNQVVADFDDRTLAHLQIAIGSKMRLGEAFFFSWRDPEVAGDGRTIIWIHPAVAISYKFFGSKTPDIDRDWIGALIDSANSAGGLRVVSEPDKPGG